MTFESFRQELLSFTGLEWAAVAVIVMSFVVVMTTVGLVIGPIVAYTVVILHRRARREEDARKARAPRP